MDFAAVMVEHIVPPYRALMESYDKAQSVQKGRRETKLNLLDAGRKQEPMRAGKRWMQPAGMEK